MLSKWFRDGEIDLAVAVVIIGAVILGIAVHYGIRWSERRRAAKRKEHMYEAQQYLGYEASVPHMEEEMDEMFSSAPNNT